MNRKSTINPITALYCRLSIEDGNDNESMSISNQKVLLKNYVESHGMSDYEFYVDDGYTGRNFNRPAFQQLIKDIEDKKVNCVITKDLSRLGRNYIEAGSYIEVFFPRHHVRYIAVNDGVDSNKSEELDITPFKNILNDMYSRDISRKVKTGWMISSGQGKFLGGPTPQGLIRDPETKGRLIIDPLDGKIIRKIYDLALSGMGGFKIMREMNRLQIPNTYHTEKQKEGYLWEQCRVDNILKNPFYKGAHVVCKTHQKWIRSGVVDRVPRDEWEIIEDCHEAIVSKDEWERVQQMIKRRPQKWHEKRNEYDNIFAGLLYCADCGEYMSPRYEYKRGPIDRTTKQPRELMDFIVFDCSTYIRHGKNVCQNHRLEARALYEVVLADIKQHAKKAIDDPETFYKELMKKVEGKSSKDTSELIKELETLKARNGELDRMFVSTYEDKSRGILSEKRFLMLSESIEKEQSEVLGKIANLEKRLEVAGSKARKVEEFAEEIRQYAEITELTDEILHKLIQRIEVGRTEEIDGERIQHIKVIYDFVGEIGTDVEIEFMNGNYKSAKVRLASDK